MTREGLIQVLAAAMPELRERFGVESLSIFGSAARAEHGPTSDVDVLATFNRPMSLFSMARLQRRLEELVGTNVDLGTPDSLRPSIRDEVMREALRVA